MRFIFKLGPLQRIYSEGAHKVHDYKKAGWRPICTIVRIAHISNANRQSIGSAHPIARVLDVEYDDGETSSSEESAEDDQVAGSHHGEDGQARSDKDSILSVDSAEDGGSTGHGTDSIISSATSSTRASPALDAAGPGSIHAPIDADAYETEVHCLACHKWGRQSITDLLHYRCPGYVVDLTRG